MTIQASIIGLGNIGMGYDLNNEDERAVNSLASAFYLHKEFSLIGGIDIDSSKRKIFEEKFNKPTYKNIQDQIQVSKPDVVVISTPTKSHFSIYKELVSEYSPKAILCEKPLSYNIDEARKMVNLSTGKDIPLFTNYMRRCNPSVIEFKNKITEGKFKHPIKGVCWYSKGLFHNGSHFLNLFQYWLGKVRDFKIINHGSSLNTIDIEPDVIINFDYGEILFLSTGVDSFSYCGVELIGESGHMHYEGNQISLSMISPDKNRSDLLNNTKEKIFLDSSKPQWYVVDQVYQYLTGNKTTICTGKQGLSTLEVIMKIKEKL